METFRFTNLYIMYKQKGGKRKNKTTYKNKTEKIIKRNKNILSLKLKKI